MIHNMYNPDPADIVNEREPSSNEDSDEFREYMALKDRHRVVNQEIIFTLDLIADDSEHGSLYDAIESMPEDERSKLRDLQIQQRHIQDRMEELRLDLEAQGMGGFI